jgi:DNA polymerase
MLEQEKILKSLAMAGVEWELESSELRVKSSELSEHVCKQAHNSELLTLNSELSVFSAPKAAAPIANADIMAAAHRLAAADDICAGIAGFTQHPLYTGAKNTVPPQLRPAPCKLLVITDIPSMSDDACGRILTGAGGELFDKMMSAIGLSRDDISITPLVFWRPAGGRSPTADELSFCRPFIDRIIADARPEKILTLGAAAAREIAGAVLPRDHGKQFAVMNSQCAVIYKPDFILQNPAVKRDVWEALKLI